METNEYKFNVGDRVIIDSRRCCMFNGHGGVIRARVVMCAYDYASGYRVEMDLGESVECTFAALETEVRAA